ncbi:MAG: riboflavin synthase [Candidatus Omnitrophica bacterium]|nr:riboflavin synthase [Candidatus Omnitrophota bacterium]
MFTGIVRELGKVRGIRRAGNTYRLTIDAPLAAREARTGYSVSVNGVCLTAVSVKNGAITFDVVEETARKTGLGSLASGDAINVEGSLKAGDQLGGHFVLGHIDCTGRVERVSKRAMDYAVEISFPAEYGHLIVPKGAVAVDGVSLTLGDVGRDAFTLYIIPHTLEATTLKDKKCGDTVNIEFDIMGKYAARYSELGRTSKVNDSFLKEHGFS